MAIGNNAETLLSVTGALAGYAGQMAIWQNYIIPKRPLPPNGFLSLVAQQFIVKTKNVLDPILAVQIVMQSAIIASKYDARTLKFRQPH